MYIIRMSKKLQKKKRPAKAAPKSGISSVTAAVKLYYWRVIVIALLVLFIGFSHLKNATKSASGNPTPEEVEATKQKKLQERLTDLRQKIRPHLQKTHGLLVYDTQGPITDETDVTCRRYSATGSAFQICVAKNYDRLDEKDSLLRQRLVGNIRPIRSAFWYQKKAATTGSPVISVESDLNNILKIHKSVELNGIWDKIKLIVSPIAEDNAEGMVMRENATVLENLDQLLPFLEFKNVFLLINVNDERMCNLFEKADKLMNSKRANVHLVIFKWSAGHSAAKRHCLATILTFLYTVGFREIASVPEEIRESLKLGKLERWKNAFGYIGWIRVKNRNFLA